MDNNFLQTVVREFPPCNFCNEKAKYDGRTSLGTWNFMCQEHFDIYGTGLGLGNGQKLVLPEKDEEVYMGSHEECDKHFDKLAEEKL